MLLLLPLLPIRTPLKQSNFWLTLMLPRLVLPPPGVLLMMERLLSSLVTTSCKKLRIMFPRSEWKMVICLRSNTLLTKN